MGAQITQYFFCQQCGKQEQNSMNMAKHIRSKHESLLDAAIEMAKHSIKSDGSSQRFPQCG